jgi:hypothetical protein
VLNWIDGWTGSIATGLPGKPCAPRCLEAGRDSRVLREKAEVDALTTFRFYEERRESLGERFRNHIGIAFGRIQASPERCWLAVPRHALAYRLLRG